jgi:hypothetical protein
MNIRYTAFLAISSLALLGQPAAAAAPGNDSRVIERGRYLAMVSGCNDCHTPGYPEAAGKIPAEKWLTGSTVGFQGPWGTSYPVNLRLYVQNMSEAQWLARVRQPMRPPMPWFNLRDMSDRDLIAMYRFIRTLGPSGAPAPLALGPGEPVATPYIEFVPKNLPGPVKHAQR